MSDTWMTESVREAMARVDAAAAETRQAAREAAEAVRQAKARAADPQEHSRLEAKVAALFRSGGAGDAARQLQSLVDRDELSWSEIQSGGPDQEATRLYLENQATMLDAVARLHREEEDETPDEEDGTSFEDDIDSALPGWESG